MFFIIKENSAMKIKFTILIFSLLAVFFLFSFSSSFAQENDTTKLNIKQYFLVLLKAGSNKSIDSLQREKIQEGHMANIRRLAKLKKLVVAGPFGDNGDLRGIFIFDVPTKEEVETLLQTDPAIKAGRLSYEIHPWWTQPGTCFP